MREEKIKLLKTAWKMFNSGKYPKSIALVGFNNYKGRSFAGILCTLLKEKLKLRWQKFDDYVAVGEGCWGSTIPEEITNYFSLPEETKFVNNDELYTYMLKNTK